MLPSVIFREAPWKSAVASGPSRTAVVSPSIVRYSPGSETTYAPGKASYSGAAPGQSPSVATSRPLSSTPSMPSRPAMESVPVPDSIPCSPSSAGPRTARVCATVSSPRV